MVALRMKGDEEGRCCGRGGKESHVCSIKSVKLVV